MGKEEIRHCPACGGTAKVRYKMPYTWVECKRCGLMGAQISDWYEQRDPESRKAAIEDWNTMEVVDEL